MLTLGLGDLATRVVRGLRTRGRIPLQMDEVIVPVARMIDLSDPLYAQNPSTWMCSTGQAGGAAAAPFIIFSNMTPNTTVSIDNCVITNTGAAADIYNVQLLRGLAFGGGTVGVVLNQTSPLNVPPNLRQQRGTGAFGGSPTQLYFVNLAPLISTPVFPLGIVLYPNDSLAFFTGTAAVGSQIQVTAWGREFLAG